MRISDRGEDEQIARTGSRGSTRGAASHVSRAGSRGSSIEEIYTLGGLVLSAPTLVDGPTATPYYSTCLVEWSTNVPAYHRLRYKKRGAAEWEEVTDWTSELDIDAAINLLLDVDDRVWSICGSRIAKATFLSHDPDVRDWIENEDVDITNHDKSEYVILAVAAEKTVTLVNTFFFPDLYWRNKTDSGAWTKITNDSGEVRIPTTDVTDLVTQTSILEEVCGCTCDVDYDMGFEREGEVDIPLYLYGHLPPGWSETHCAIDLTNALNGKEYEFRLIDDDFGSGIVPGSIVTITTAE